MALLCCMRYVGDGGGNKGIKIVINRGKSKVDEIPKTQEKNNQGFQRGANKKIKSKNDGITNYEHPLSIQYLIFLINLRMRELI